MVPEQDIPETDIAEVVDAAVARHGRGPDAVTPILQGIQEHFHYLPEAALRRVCSVTDIAMADLYSVATFFPQFRWTPAGRHTISVCDGTACHLKGAPAVYDAFASALKIPRGEDTAQDRSFTIRKVRCLGCCTLAPAVQIDSITYGHVSPNAVPGILREFLAHADQRDDGDAAKASTEAPTGAEIRIGLGSCCVAGGSERVRQVLEDTVKTYDLDVRIKHVSCVGMCHQTPLLEVLVPGQAARLFAKVQPEDVAAIVLGQFPPRAALSKVKARAQRWLERFYAGAAEDHRALDARQGTVAAFLSGQHRIATEHCGEIAPLDLAEHFRHDGFRAVYECLRPLGAAKPDQATLWPTKRDAELPPDAIVEEIRNSGLRGRGGGGFPTARKWAEVRKASGADKVVICNGDEGDPGAFMDRMILESYPYRVIEGMLIASVAVGAARGVFYIRSEYPLAVARVREALSRCRAAGLLGDRVMGSTHAFDIEVREGAGAFVCGEETALIASLEGVRPTPRHRPPYPAHRGLHGAPTLVNNVETFSLVPWILRHGAAAFGAMGSEGSKGAKVFALAGKVKRGGLIEVPMGTTLRRIVEEIGGGVEEGRVLKAIQVGGPSGGCIPAALADLPVDYETLTGAGAMMGSGGLVVLDDTDCVVEMSRYFLSFTQLESCGKCTPCRVGTRQMLEILSKLCEGKGTHEDLDRLRQLALTVKQQSLCGLGRTAPNPILSGLTHFHDEFVAHAEGRCPARKCRALVRYTINEQCIGCTKCAQKCPAGAIEIRPYARHEIDPSKCVRCGGCYAICPVEAVEAD